MIAMDEGYDTTKELIKSTAKKFYMRHGGHLDDLIADANTAFVEGHQRFCRDKSYRERQSYEQMVRRRVWRVLLDGFRSRTGHRNQVREATAYEFIEEIAEQQNSSFNVQDFLEELSEDARTAVLLVLDTPPDLARVARLKGGQPRNFRSTMREYLRKQGWDITRINASFEEVREALK